MTAQQQDNQLGKITLEAIVFNDYFEANRFFSEIKKPMSQQEFIEKLKKLLNNNETT